MLRELRPSHQLKGVEVVLFKVTLPLIERPAGDLIQEALKKEYSLRDSQIQELKELVQDPKSKVMLLMVLDGTDEMKASARHLNLFKVCFERSIVNGRLLIELNPN